MGDGIGEVKSGFGGVECLERSLILTGWRPIFTAVRWPSKALGDKDCRASLEDGRLTALLKLPWAKPSAFQAI